MHRQPNVEIAAFDTRLGWVAFAAAEQVLVRMTFGHQTRLAAIRGLALPGLPVVAAAELWSELVERLSDYAAGEADDLSGIELDLAHLGPFERRVVEQCRRIPYGQTCTYGRLAALAGSPRAARPVGNVMAGNRFPLVVPCHRVVPAGGKLGRYSAPAGSCMKLRLLQLEGFQPGKPLLPSRLAAAGN